MFGLRYPLRVVNGTLIGSGDEDRLYKDAVMSAIQTHQGERVLRPPYGVGLEPFSRTSVTGDLENQLRVDLNACMVDYEDRSIALQTSIREGGVDIELLYWDNTKEYSRV